MNPEKLFKIPIFSKYLSKRQFSLLYQEYWTFYS